jgi:hypothetical protein
VKARPVSFGHLAIDGQMQLEDVVVDGQAGPFPPVEPIVSESRLTGWVSAS